MALQDVSGITLPFQPLAISYQAMLLDAVGEKAAVIFSAPKTGTIDRVCWRTSAVTTGTDTDVRLETVDDTTGDPSGTLFGTTTNVTQAAAGITTNTWIENTLTAGASVTKGDMIALVIAPTGTPSYNVARLLSSESLVSPYTDLYTGTWTKSASNGVCAVRYSDGTYPYIAGVFPLSAASSVSITAAGTPDEVGNLINLPFKCSVTGLVVDTATTANISTLTAKLYDSSNNVLASKVYDYNQIQGAGIGYIRFDTSIVLDAATDYRATVEATTATARAIKYSDVASTALRDALSIGSSFIWTQRTDAGGWTETATRRAGIGLMINQLDDGAGGGGGTTNIFNVME